MPVSQPREEIESPDPLARGRRVWEFFVNDNHSQHESNSSRREPPSSQCGHFGKRAEATGDVDGHVDTREPKRELRLALANGNRPGDT